jgi:D-galactose 1-dehydrogenase/L-arabinose 1- dehydrogenase
VTAPLRIGLVGVGKIARDQHLPAIAGTAGVELAAAASRHAKLPEVANYPDLAAMLAGEPGLDAVALCQPPRFRYEAAKAALTAGKHVFLEKPPGVTVSEVEALADLAKDCGVTLFASWHSRYAAAVAQARDWVEANNLGRISIQWKEDVRHWHPGQSWIWEAGGFGVFDPGINALSILTEIVQEPIRVIEARLEVPSNRAAPIAAALRLETIGGAPIEVAFDWRQTGPQSWDIAVEAQPGRMLLSNGGNAITIDGQPQPVGKEDEYPAMYRRFLELIRSGQSDVDCRPLRLVADAFLCGRQIPTSPFED